MLITDPLSRLCREATPEQLDRFVRLTTRVCGRRPTAGAVRALFTASRIRRERGLAPTA